MDLNLIGVIRLSTDEQAREGKAGIDRQVADIERIRIANQATIIRTMEVIESGTRVMDHRDFHQLFQDLSKPGIHGVAVSSLDRLVRPDNFSDFTLFDYFKKNGKRIYTPNGALDPNTQNGWLEALMRGMFAGMERQEIRKRTMGGKERLRIQGRAVNGRNAIPRGILYDKATGVWSYDLDPTNLTAPRRDDGIPGDALLIRKAFELLVFKHASYQAMVEEIGGNFTEICLRYTMRNPIWIGIRRYDKERVGEYQRPKNDPEGEAYRRSGKRSEILEKQVIAKPLVPVALFEEAQRIMATRRDSHGSRKKLPRFLLSNLVWCPCGKVMYIRCGSGSGRKKKRDYYYCSSYAKGKGCGMPTIRREALDELFQGRVIDYLLNVEFLMRVFRVSKRISGSQASGEAERFRQREIAKLEEQRENLIDLRVSSAITRKEFDQRQRGIEEARKALDVLHPPKTLDKPSETRQLIEMLITALAQFRELPFNDKRALLQRAVRRIMISGQGRLQSLTLSGGFLTGMTWGVNLQSRSTALTEFSALDDVVIEFPKPLVIQRHDQRRRASA